MITVTSRAGNNNGGFSLLELILVLMVLGLGSLVVLPTIDRSLRDQEVRRSALALAAAARELRSRAIHNGMPQQLLLNLAQNSYLIARDREVRLPSDVKISDVQGGETLNSDERQFLFFPNGSTFGGRVNVASANDSVSYAVRLHPLTGHIEVLRGDKT